MKKQPAKQYVIYSRKSKFTGKVRASKIRSNCAASILHPTMVLSRQRMPLFMKMRDFPVVIWSVLNLKR